MYKTIGAEQWETLNKLDAESLSEKIQGLQLQSCEPLINQIAWTGPDTNTKSGTRTKELLTEWLRKLSLQDLQKFVKAVTGSTSFTKKTKLNMRLYTPVYTDEEQRRFPNNTYMTKFPLSHSCFNILDIPSDYPNQEIFKLKMDEFLASASFGAGFTVE